MELRLQPVQTARRQPTLGGTAAFNLQAGLGRAAVAAVRRCAATRTYSPPISRPLENNSLPLRQRRLAPWRATSGFSQRRRKLSDTAKRRIAFSGYSTGLSSGLALLGLGVLLVLGDA
jgi:hypothetical protein